MFSKFKVKTSALLIIALSALLIAGCSPGSPGYPTVGLEKIKATWVTAEKIQGGLALALPVETVQKNKIVHYWVDIPEGQMPFMAYQLDSKTYVRANLCVPCRSYNYSLENGVLVCDTCGSRFSAVTGDGISGACKAYPKALVDYKVENARLVVTVEDSKVSYFETLEPGWP